MSVTEVTVKSLDWPLPISENLLMTRPTSTAAKEAPVFTVRYTVVMTSDRMSGTSEFVTQSRAEAERTAAEWRAFGARHEIPGFTVALITSTTGGK